MFRCVFICVKTFYTLSVAGFSGDGGESLSFHSGSKFTTKDQDNDRDGGSNCAQRFQGAWW